MLLFELVVLGAALTQDAKHNAQYKENIKRWHQEGRDVPSDGNRHERLFLDFCHNFNFEDKKYVPEEYWPYFHMNPKALNAYCFALTAQEEYKEGLRPYLCSVMPAPGHDFFAGFHNKYDEKIQQYNENGRYYS